CPAKSQRTGIRREDVNWIGALAHITKQAFNGIGGLNVSVHRLRKGVKSQEMLFVLSQASHRFGIAQSVLGGSRPPIVSMLPALLVAPRSPRVQLGRLRAPGAGWHSRHCVVYAPDSADAGWPQTAPRP